MLNLNSLLYMLVMLFEHCLLVLFARTSISGRQRHPRVLLFVFFLIIGQYWWQLLKVCTVSTSCFCSLICKPKARSTPSNGEPIDWIDILFLLKSKSSQQHSKGGGVRVCNSFHCKRAIASFMLEYLSTIHQVTLLFFTSLATFMNQGFPFVSTVT